MNPRTQSRMIWITLMACILVALMPASGFVLCLGQDGHVGFGVAATPPTSEAGTVICPCVEVSSEMLGEDQRDDDHPPCRDLEVDESPLVFSEGGSADVDIDGPKDERPQLPLPLAAVLPRAMPDRGAGSQGLRSPGALPSLVLLARRTIVLQV